MKKETNYLIFWFGQGVSQLGSSMAGFALTIWGLMHFNLQQHPLLLVY